MAGLIRVAHRITGSDEPTMAAQIMGSVGVRQAAITKDEMKLIGGKITKTRPADTVLACGRGQTSAEHTCDDKPPECHCRYHHDEQALGVIGEVRLRKLDTDREEARREHNAHHFQCDFVAIIVPGPRVEYVGAMGPHYNAERGPEDDLVEVELGHRQCYTRVHTIPIYTPSP